MPLKLREFCAYGLGVLVLTGVASRYGKPDVAMAAPAARQVELPIAHKDAPVVVTSVTVFGKVVQAGRVAKPFPDLDPTTPFEGDDGWIQNLTVHLLNRTDRPIDFLQITLLFPETGNGSAASPVRVCYLQLGRVPTGVEVLPDGRPYPEGPDRNPLGFQPGQTIDIRLLDYIDKIRAGARTAIALEAATVIKLDPSKFYFTGGMRWLAGGFQDPDAQHPGKWHYKGAAYFPGDTSLNWPSGGR